MKHLLRVLGNQIELVVKSKISHFKVMTESFSKVRAQLNMWLIGYQIKESLGLCLQILERYSVICATLTEKIWPHSPQKWTSGAFKSKNFDIFVTKMNKVRHWSRLIHVRALDLEN